MAPNIPTRAVLNPSIIPRPCLPPLTGLPDSVVSQSWLSPDAGTCRLGLPPAVNDKVTGRCFAPLVEVICIICVNCVCDEVGCRSCIAFTIGNCRSVNSGDSSLVGLV